MRLVQISSLFDRVGQAIADLLDLLAFDQMRERCATVLHAVGHVVSRHSPADKRLA